MPELTPIEKLQPCLLDRLTDHEPRRAQESRSERVISLDKYRRGVVRDLEWLFNTSAHLPEEGSGKLRLEDFPEAHSSVINFGIRQLCGLIAPDMRELERELVRALRKFEPRLLRNSLKVEARLERQALFIEVRAELFATPIPEPLFVRTVVDLEGGASEAGEHGDGRTVS